MVKKWPRVHAGGNATRAQFLAWVEKETGEELSTFFNAWLMGRRTPERSN
jgi:aminopeptidase N